MGSDSVENCSRSCRSSAKLGGVAEYQLTPEQEERRRKAEANRTATDAALAAHGASSEQAAALRSFFNHFGALTQIPMQHSKRLVLLDILSQQFAPGEIYPERDVNLIIGRFHRDWAALRRYLVDEGFMERRDGFYWRAGGTFDVH
jgi:hypothetical protein